MKTKRTTGPWECGRYHHIVLPTKDLPASEGGGWAIAHVYGDNDRRTANAKLIAEAPLLLECLQEAAAQYKCGCEHPACNQCSRDAEWAEVIARATDTET